MADITITVPIKSVFREVARRSAVATETDPFYAQKSTEEKQYSQLQGEGDRITNDFVKEAAKEVLKAYLSRQGDVAGAAFEYGYAAVNAVKQKETVTLNGTSGYLYIASIAPDTKQVVFDTSLTITAGNFVTANATYYLGLGIVLTYSGEDIIFEASIAGVPFTAPTLLGEQLLYGTVTHTTSNVTASNAGNIIYRFSENSSPLSGNQTAAIVNRLTSNTKDAIVYYVLVSLYRTDGNQKKEAELLAKALTLIDELSGDLYRLHD